MAAQYGSRGAVSTPVLLFLCGLLAGCGTNVQWLLAEEGRLTLEADRLVSVAEDAGNGMEQSVYDAEDAKHEACRFLTEATVERMQQEPTLGEQFVSDLSSVIVLVVPVGPVERCADALHAYRDSIAQLRRQLIDLGAVAGTPTASAASS